MLDIVLDEARVQSFFNKNIAFVEDLMEEQKVYRQNDGKIAIVMDFIHENITEITLEYLQGICESMYFKYDEIPVDMYVILLGCTVLVKECTIPSLAEFSIKMCCRDYSYL